MLPKRHKILPIKAGFPRASAGVIELVISVSNEIYLAKLCGSMVIPTSPFRPCTWTFRRNIHKFPPNKRMLLT